MPLDAICLTAVVEELKKTLDPTKYTGRACVQVEAFLKNVVNPMLAMHEQLPS